MEELKQYQIALEQFKNGDFTHFNEFYEQVKKPVFYNILSLTRDEFLAEDILMDTFVKFLQNINKMDSTKSILGFLIVTSRNLALDYFKKHNRVEKIDESQTQMFVHNDTRSLMKINFLLEKIRSLLNDEEYDIFCLHTLSDLTFNEISNIKNKKLGTVLWQYNNAIKKVRKEINYEEYQ